MSYSPAVLISLNWIGDYVDLPGDPDPLALAEKFTRTTAEVDGVHRIEVAAKGLICACVKGIVLLGDMSKAGRDPLTLPSPPGGERGSVNQPQGERSCGAQLEREKGSAVQTRILRLVTLEVGGEKTVETVSAAPVLRVGDQVVYAPPGASVTSLGTIGTTTIAGRTSAGMILAADSIGIDAGGQEAVFLSHEYKPGDALPSELFDDWLIEIDNKSLTNRPDLWGHYGIAREIAAITRRGLQSARTLGISNRLSSARAEARGSLKALPLAPLEELTAGSCSEIPIAIADAAACPRYSALVVEGVPTLPAPLWMQLRLGHVGQRPISGLVDLTNYIMMDIGQPMHAFDAEKVRRIEVDWAADVERFKTLDGVERTLTRTDLMIKSRGKSVALAGVMGGLETEVSEDTTSLLLESANFDGATIRRTARRLNLRSEASARFEKSLDPANTVTGIQRFVHLAKAMYPEIRITSRLSDAYPRPASQARVVVQPGHVARTMGREVAVDEAREVLAPLGFSVSCDDTEWTVSVPSFRATGDVSIEADVIEELARCIGYDSITPDLPHATVRTFPINALHELEQRSIEYFALVHAFNEVHGYLWYDSPWLARIGCDPGACVELRNPAGEGLHRLRRSLMPGLLAAIAMNRFHFDTLALLELGSVFEVGANKPSASQGEGVVTGEPGDRESRHLALAVAQRGKKVDDELNARLRSAIGGWAWDRFARPVRYLESSEPRTAVRATLVPWEHAQRTADIMIDEKSIGRISVIDVALRRAMDEHLAAWGITWAELCLNGLENIPRTIETLGATPPFPLVAEDFSILVPRTQRYAEVKGELSRFAHPLLKSLRFVASFDGDARTGNKRSLTFRCTLGHDARTLADSDTTAFRSAFEGHLARAGFEIRKC